MDEQNSQTNPTRRSEPRTIVDLYYSVEFSIEGLDLIYQFIIYDVSQKGICILVKEDSPVLGRLNVGDVFNMKYYPIKLLGPTEHLKTEIRHITKERSGRYKNHFLIGLVVKEKLPIPAH